MRRFALSAQGLLQASPFGRGVGAAHSAIRHIGYVQIDTIAVVQRAHHHVFRSRVPNYNPDMLQRLMRERRVFEYWSHAAAFLPMQDFRFSLPYKHAIKSGKRHWYRTRDRKLMNDMLQRIEREGPLRSRDVKQDKRKGAGWWDWKPAKRALEQLYMQGDLMITDRTGFQKAYDLPERVLPADVNTTMPTTEEYAAHLVEQQLRCHGFVSSKGLTYLRRDNELRTEVNRQVNAHLGEKTLQALTLGNGETFFCKNGLIDQVAPRVSNRLVILSPFDNAVIQRARLQSVFDFDYQIECYLPAKKRRYGYFCLPLLYRDQFVGRMDSKTHRKSGVFEVKSLHLQPVTGKESNLLAAFASALAEFVEFQGCQQVCLRRVTPRSVTKPLRQLLNSRLDVV